MSSQYISINASAGSGKTYTLVQQVLKICLQNPAQSDAIRHILALTFTNKAANEMKQRILTWLRNFSDDNFAENQELQNLQKSFEEDGITISLENLHNRSKKVLDYILHHYSTLNIGTIDKFNARLVRSFSYELGLAQNFNLEIQAEPLLIEAIDQTLDQIGEQKEISKAFMDYVFYNLEKNDRINLNKTLYNSAKELIKDVHYDELKKNEHFDWVAYESTKNQQRDELKSLQQQSVKIAKDSLQLIIDNDLEIGDFSSGSSGIGGFFEKFLVYEHQNKKEFPLPKNETDYIEKIQKGASTKGKKKEPQIFAILETLIQNRYQIIQNYVSIKKKEKILAQLLPLRINKDIQQKLQEIETENDLVLLSKFNILINENLKNEPSAFIYEKVGTQFFHYFFDEFQDTSQLQWNNFLPLRDHTIHSQDTSFTIVGDPKQSIYRFRGGDSKIMLNINNGNENTNIKATVKTLKYNHRSAKNIVQFNNDLYAFCAPFLDTEYQPIFSEDAKQIATSTIPGRVKVHLIENSNLAEFYQETAEKMQKSIQECIDNGFQFSDICILCRKNDEILQLSQILGNLKVHYQSEECYIRTISESGLTLDLSQTLGAILAFLHWENSPRNYRDLVKMMYLLKETGRISMGDFTAEMLTILDLQDKKAIENYINEHYGIALQQQNAPKLNLYNYIEYYVQEFSVSGKETDFLLNFLELLYNFSQKTGTTLKDFLQFWEEEGAKTAILASENTDAIEVMTIHKAKGLEFPVVFLPMTNSNKDGKVDFWYHLENGNELKSVPIQSSDVLLDNYDEEMMAYFAENTNRNKFDRFCMQYVATTRAVEQLFLFLEQPTEKNGVFNESKIEIVDFVCQNNLGTLDEFDLYAITDEQKKKQNKESQNSQKIVAIDSIASSGNEKATIKIATPSKNYQNRVEKVRLGIFTHEILAKIKTENQVEKVLESYQIAGTITTKEKTEIADRIFAVIRNPEFAPYFAENLEIINEREILLSENGKSHYYRPDRIIKTDSGYIIIDFKTGEEKEKSHEKHEQQVATYKSVLEKLEKTVLKTVLIYV